jgi:hypothetical protein
LPDGSAIVAEVEQDSEAEIAGGVAMLCEARVGTVAWNREFGIPGVLGQTDEAEPDQPNEAAADIEAAIAEHENRLAFGVRVTSGPRGGREIRLRVRP